MAGLMTPDTWRRISEVLGEALELPPDQREEFLIGACHGDAQLLGSVRAMIEHNGRLGDFLLSPVPGAPGRLQLENCAPRLEPGMVLGGRFRIEQLIGRGGMGEVYGAHDTELGEPVAIKLMRDDVQAAGHLPRFRREIRLARRISHPNVCRVYDLFRDEVNGRQTCFYVMELLSGESLADVLSRGGMCPVRATEIAQDVACGLTAAHRAGTIHRDLKPSNIVLVTSGGEARAVITDFGLAAAREPSMSQTTLTRTGGILGTPGYMSPEQTAGGEVTSASDIYAYGVLLGKILAAVDVCPPGMKTAWGKAIAKCTAFEASARFTDAEQAFRIANSRWPGFRLTRRQWLSAGGGVAVATVSLAVGISRLIGRGRVLRPGAMVLIADIANTTGEPILNNAAEALRVHAGDSGNLQIVDRARLHGVLRQMSLDESKLTPAVAREAGWRLNAAAVVFGAIGKVGSDYTLTLEIEAAGAAPQNPSRTAIRTFPARDQSALLTAVRDAAFWLRSEAGESVDAMSLRDGLPPDVTTPSWQALSFYGEAEKLAIAGHTSDALLKLGEALDSDPAFTLASSRKADLLMNLQRHRESLAQWKFTLDTLKTRRVTRREELYARAMYAYDTGDISEAGRLFATWAEEYPNDWRGHFYRVVPLMLHGHAAEGIREMERTLQLNPEYTHAYAHIANCATALGDWQRARDAIAALRKRGERERPLLKEAALHLAKNDLVAARHCLIEAQGSTAVLWQIRGRLYQAMLELEAGAPDHALAILTGGRERLLAPEADADRAYWHAARAFAAQRSGERRIAFEAANAALDIEDGPIVTRHAGSIFARIGRLEAAQALAGKMRQFSGIRHYTISALAIEGEIARARGELQAAAGAFRNAGGLLPPISDRSALASVLAKSGDSETARVLYRATADSAFLVFFEPMRQEPGVWGDSVRWLQQNS